MTSDNKVVLITGGGSGMGRRAAQNLADQGHHIALFDIDAQGLEVTAQGRDNIHYWTVDITDSAAVFAAVKEVETKLGAIDRLFNCAAIMPYGKLLEQDIAVIHKVMAINYGGLVNISQAVLPGMVSRGRGDFISFASIAGLVPTMITGAYSASKSAVCTFSEILYHEHINSGVRFACVCPPAVDTPLLEQGRSTHWPKMLEISGDPLTPDAVLDAVETGLAKGKFWIIPGASTRFAYRMRRWLPSWLWKQVHKTEGF